MLYLARRFYKGKVTRSYYDFLLEKSINSDVFFFKQDIRDFVSASKLTVLVEE